MKYHVTDVSPTVEVHVTVEDGPEMYDHSVHNRCWFTVENVQLTYTLGSDGNWDTDHRDDVVLAGWATGADREWTAATLPENEFCTMDVSHPWLYRLIDQLAPSGDVDTIDHAHDAEETR